MSHHEPDDWRKIAHDEYENRKSMELQLSQTTNALSTLKQTLTTSNNYNKMLEKKLAELEAKCADQESKLNRSIELLKNAKLLFAKRKQELENLTVENNQLKHDLIKKTALLEAEMLQHEKTNSKFAQTLSKLAATTAASNASRALAPPARTYAGSSSVIYAEAAPPEPKPSAHEGIVNKMFAFYDTEVYDEIVDLDQEFMDHVLYFNQQFNK